MSIFSFFGGKKPAKRLPVKGLRGTGGIGAQKRKGAGIPQATLDEEEVRGFLEDGEAIYVSSSCIGLVQWTAGHLMVEFKDDIAEQVTGVYLYLNVPRELVVEFLRAGSKGHFVSTRLVWAKWPFKKLS